MFLESTDIWDDCGPSKWCTGTSIGGNWSRRKMIFSTNRLVWGMPRPRVHADEELILLLLLFPFFALDAVYSGNLVGSQVSAGFIWLDEIRIKIWRSIVVGSLWGTRSWMSQSAIVGTKVNIGQMQKSARYICIFLGSLENDSSFCDSHWLLCCKTF